MGPWLANNIRLCDGLATSMSYWDFSDVFEEQGVVKTLFYGGFGLIATGNISKAALNAFRLLHLLGEERLVLESEAALATRRADGSLAIAVWNYAAPEEHGATQGFIRDHVRTHLACEAVVVSAQIESDLVDLAPDEAKEFLQELAWPNPAPASSSRAAYHVLACGLFTFNEKEVRAWTIHTGDTAVKAAGAIHTDFERGFIKAETVNCDDLVKCASSMCGRRACWIGARLPRNGGISKCRWSLRSLIWNN